MDIYDGLLELVPSTYLGTPPEHPGMSIIIWRTNSNYKKEKEYIKDGDYYYKEDYPNFRYHKDCFKNPFYNYAIAHFIYDKGCYTLEFIDDRPLELDNKQWIRLKELIKEGFETLNDYENWICCWKK